MSPATFNIAVDIDAPPERVFAVLCDVERWPEWTSSTTRVQRLERGAFAIGARARVTQPKLLPAVWEVTEMEQNRSFTWTTRGPGVFMTASHSIEARGAVSRGTLSLEMSGFLGPLIRWFYGRLIEQYINTEAQGLKRRSEERSAAP